MGSNATGKTSLGIVLLKIFGYINTGNEALILEMASSLHTEGTETKELLKTFKSGSWHFGSYS